MELLQQMVVVMPLLGLRRVTLVTMRTLFGSGDIITR